MLDAIPAYAAQGTAIYQWDATSDEWPIADNSVQCCVTSPPYYGLRTYDVEGQIGLERTPEAYIQRLVCVFQQVKRVLRDDGILYVNIGDSYAGSGKGPSNSIQRAASNLSNVAAAPNTWLKVPSGCKSKDLIGIPWMLAFALRDDGWYLRSEIIWAKKACMPESIDDRPTSAHEAIFLLTKSPRYYYNADAVREPLAESSIARAKYSMDAARKVRGSPDGGHARGTDEQMIHLDRGANQRNVWRLGPEPHRNLGHFASFPSEIPRRAILAGSREGDLILDCFLGSGTTAIVARQLGRRVVGLELNPDYIAIASRRLLEVPVPMFAPETPVLEAVG